MQNSSKILLISSVVFILAALVIQFTSKSSPPDKSTSNINPIIEVDLSETDLKLNDFILDTSITYHRKRPEYNNPDTSITLVHTLRALSCNNCLYDNEYLINHIEAHFQNLNQMIWFIDSINSYSISLAKRHSKGKDYFLGFNDKYLGSSEANTLEWVFLKVF